MDDAVEVSWDGKSLGGWARHVDGAAAVINLVGKSLDCRHTTANKKLIRESRVDAINVLAKACVQAAAGPEVSIQVSAVGYYGDAGDVLCTESSPKGGGFIADVVELCETTFVGVAPPGVRKVMLRLGFVMGGDAAGLKKLASLARWGLGGTVGSGRQYMSWVHIDDVAEAFAFAVENQSVRGILNVVAPNPARNSEFMRALRSELGAPWSPPVPVPLVKIGAAILGTQADLALDSQRVSSARIVSLGFDFQHVELRSALEDALQ